ncbi:hypothetical protein CsSME_00010152 [Camellia sinensis var. sinensis]
MIRPNQAYCKFESRSRTVGPTYQVTKDPNTIGHESFFFGSAIQPDNFDRNSCDMTWVSPNPDLGRPGQAPLHPYTSPTRQNNRDW